MDTTNLKASSLASSLNAAWMVALFKRFRICSSTQLSKVIFPFLVIISLYYLMNILVVPRVFMPQDVETNVLGKINFKLVNYVIY